MIQTNGFRTFHIVTTCNLTLQVAFFLGNEAALHTRSVWSTLQQLGDGVTGEVMATIIAKQLEDAGVPSYEQLKGTQTEGYVPSILSDMQIHGLMLN